MADAIAMTTSSRHVPGGASAEPLPNQLVGGAHDEVIFDESGPQGLVVFTLIRGGRGDSYEMYVNSRACLRKAVPAFVDYADVAFHEGNVGLD
eukprot:1945804-Prymnesium_polylepis.1